jgi:membrane-associated phospholipid phosphatase
MAGSDGPSPPPRHPLLPVERALLGYLALITPVALLRSLQRPITLWVVGINLAIVLLVLLVRRSATNGSGQWLRELYPLLLLLALYSELDLFNGFEVTPIHDAAVQGWEAKLFGGQISRDWWRSGPSGFWSTILHGAYFSYYPIVMGPAALFLFRGNLPAVRRAVCWTVVTFLFCYLCFLGFPVAGPYYEFTRPTGPFVDNPMARLVYATLAEGSSYGTAFPSSHVAAAISSTSAAFVGSRRLGLALLVPTGLLMVGVVYCQMHYAVDAVAGAAVAGLVVGIGLRNERREASSEFRGCSLGTRSSGPAY